MLNSEQNKNWKQELEQIELHSSDLSFEKAVAWDKLYQRLEKPEGKKRVVWFKWAAVFIVLSSLLSYYIINQSSFSNSTESPITIKESKATESLTRTKHIEPTINKEAVVSKELKEPTQHQEEKINRRVEVKAIPVSASTIAQLPSENLVTPNNIAISAPLADTFRNITIAGLPEKKKLRVIHINDYVVPVKPTLMMVNVENSSSNIFRLNYSTSSDGENSNSNTAPAPPLLKIKITPQN